MDKATRLQKYGKLSDSFKALFSSDESMMMHFSVVSKFNIEKKDTYIECIGDTILGFHHTKDLPQLLQKEVGLSADEAQRVVADLAEFLSPVLAREEEQANAKKVELQAMSQQFATKPAPPNEAGGAVAEARETTAEAATVDTPVPATTAVSENAPQPTPTTQPDTSTVAAATTGDIHDVVPMRSLKGDMQRVHGYGAYREQHPIEPAEDNEPVYRSEQPATQRQTPLVETPEMGE